MTIATQNPPEILITNEDPLTEARHFVLSSLKACQIVKIASGYAGLGALKEALGPLTSIIENGGQVTLIFGLCYWEGITPSLEALLRDFHKIANAKNKKSGVFFCQKDRFHGKFYIFENGERKWASIGSSNFSDSGFGGWLESNTKLTLSAQIKPLEEYFSRLMRLNAKPINLLTFPSRKKELNKKRALKSKTPLPKNILQQPIAFKLEVKPQPKSHVNLFAGSGRLTKGIYIKRGWYEIELGVQKTDMQKLKLFVRPTKTPFKLNLVDGDANVIPALFKRKTEKANSARTVLDGSDFMSIPRFELGKFIKSKLIDAGVIKYGELITEDTLDAYGNKWLEFRALPNRKGYYYISF